MRHLAPGTNNGKLHGAFRRAGLFAAFFSFVCLRPVGAITESFDRLRPKDLENLDEKATHSQINGLPVDLIFDTGCGYPMLLPEACVKRLGIGMAKAIPDDPNPIPGLPKMGLTESCNIQVLGTHIEKGPLLVARHLAENSEGKSDFDGVLGWPALRGQSTYFFLAEGEFGLLLTPMPTEVASWGKFPIVEPGNILSLVVASDSRGVHRIVVDTGDVGGVSLPPDQWQEWKASHPAARTTLRFDDTFKDRHNCSEELWADTFIVGQLEIDNVPIGEAGTLFKAAPGEKIIVFGIAALKRMNLILDGPHHMAYACGSSAPAPPYSHNRIGAMFIIPGNDRRAALVAMVVPGGPAAAAGLQDGDVLSKIEGRDIPNWDAYANLLKGWGNWNIPAGTKVSFTVRRGDKVIKITVVAKNILGPAAGAAAAVQKPAPG